MNYLKHLPKPLVEDLLAGRWLPIVGAGFSRNARVPRGKKMPLWNDLGKAPRRRSDRLSIHRRRVSFLKFFSVFSSWPAAPSPLAMRLVRFASSGRVGRFSGTIRLMQCEGLFAKDRNHGGGYLWLRAARSTPNCRASSNISRTSSSKRGISAAL